MQTPNRHEHIDALRRKVQRGDYHVPADRIAASPLLQKRLGDLTILEREVFTRAQNHRNQRAREAMAREEAALLPQPGERAFCPVHSAEYVVETGKRAIDCGLCREARELDREKREVFQKREVFRGAFPPSDGQGAFDEPHDGGWSKQEERCAAAVDWAAALVLLATLITQIGALWFLRQR